MAIKNSKELDDFLSMAENIGGDTDLITEAINDFLKKSRDNLIKYKLDASGNLFQSIKVLPIGKTVDGVTNVKIEAEDYFESVEEGTKPQGYTKENRKKLQPKILEWIGYKPELQTLAGSKEKERSLSYAITTNILKKGTIKRFGYKGKRFMTDEIPYLKEQLTKGFEEKWQ
jgi:hypothetical protein